MMIMMMIIIIIIIIIMWALSINIIYYITINKNNTIVHKVNLDIYYVY